jgi:hypothetical protein
VRDDAGFFLFLCKQGSSEMLLRAAFHDVVPRMCHADCEQTIVSMVDQCVVQEQRNSMHLGNTPKIRVVPGARPANGRCSFYTSQRGGFQVHYCIVSMLSCSGRRCGQQHTCEAGLQAHRLPREFVWNSRTNPQSTQATAKCGAYAHPSGRRNARKLVTINVVIVASCAGGSLRMLRGNVITAAMLVRIIFIVGEDPKHVRFVWPRARMARMGCLQCWRVSTGSWRPAQATDATQTESVLQVKSSKVDFATCIARSSARAGSGSRWSSVANLLIMQAKEYHWSPGYSFKYCIG